MQKAANSGLLFGPLCHFVQLWRLITRTNNSSFLYLVSVDAAVDILEEKSPQAAKWWRENRPHYFGPEQQFGFPAEVCEPLGDLDAVPESGVM